MPSRPILSLALLCTLPALGGCLAKTALDVATAPVRVAGKTVDLATTSQSEADEKRGREIRRREERLGELQRSYDKNMRRCDEGYRNACFKARNDYAEMQDILPTVPREPR
ncbi:hypothetical protein B2G71_13320 [Novosphingobium sp. PC22D]|uniref:hypothetical protein n=1 Tax=Novosphingobium sp. PC22D TaxID=1962403 RepID=UPI000BF1E536|nr:hypothetical protein [Novosphingobium sp. PC22D]PEQ12118.1 hypothetical protein B2G71_13320 [Novosphingobium sp. PC22D]